MPVQVLHISLPPHRSHLSETKIPQHNLFGSLPHVSTVAKFNNRALVRFHGSVEDERCLEIKSKAEKEKRNTISHILAAIARFY